MIIRTDTSQFFGIAPQQIYQGQYQAQFWDGIGTPNVRPTRIPACIFFCSSFCQSSTKTSSTNLRSNATSSAHTVFLFEASPRFGQASQTQTGPPAILGSPTISNDSKCSKKNPVVLDGDRTAPAEDNWWTDRKNDWERMRRERPTVEFCLFQKFDVHRDQLHVWRRGGI